MGWASGGLAEAAELWGEGDDDSHTRLRSVKTRPKTRSSFWDAYLDGKPHVLHQGKDFTCSTERMRRRAYRAGEVRALWISATVEGSTVTVQVTPTRNNVSHGMRHLRVPTTVAAEETCRRHGWTADTLLASKRWREPRKLRSFANGLAVLGGRDGQWQFARRIEVKSFPADVHEVKDERRDDAGTGREPASAERSGPHAGDDRAAAG